MITATKVIMVTVVVSAVTREVITEEVMVGVGVIKMITPIRTRTKTPVTIREAMDMDAPGVVTEGVPTAVVPTEVTLLGVKIL